MNQLFKAIALTVGHGLMNPQDKGKFEWLSDEQSEVLANSKLGASDRVMTSDLFAEAFLYKLDGFFRANSVRGMILVYADSMREVRSSFSVVKSRYQVYSAAKKAAERMNARNGSNPQYRVIAVTMSAYVSARRGVIRRNLLHATATPQEIAAGYTGWFVEALDTPNYLSPASEAYHSA